MHVPFAWDLTLFSVQDQHSTNAFVVTNLSFLKHGDDAEVSIIPGSRKRFFLANQDIHLLNARIRLDNRQTIAFGINFRSILSVRTSKVNWNDSIAELHDFLELNKNNLPLSAEVRANSWAEFYGSYARTLIDDGESILNAGITLSVNRALGGAYLTANNLNYFPAVTTGKPAYNFATGDARYGYSANIDDLRKSNGSNFQQLTQKTFTNVSASLGVEYIIPAAESEDAYAYNWKIGISLMDLGVNAYRYSDNSRFAVLNKQNISDSLVEASFDNVGSIEEVNDTLARLAGSIGRPVGNFNIIQPARLIINADRHLQGNFYINGQLTIPLTSLLSPDYLYTRDINLFNLTPRYETRAFGAYMPVTLTLQRQLWVGGALRAGPLLLGIHNWANLFSSNKIQRGGFYLALTFRPGKKKEAESSTGRNSEETHLSKRERRLLDCPPY